MMEIMLSVNYSSIGLYFDPWCIINVITYCFPIIFIIYEIIIISIPSTILTPFV